MNANEAALEVVVETARVAFAVAFATAQANAWKTCSCCRATYTAPQWHALPALGTQTSEDETGSYVLTLKNCHCGSTLGVEEKQ